MSQCGSSNCAMRIVYAVSITIGCSVLPFAFRPRIAGAVMRLPGTGEGVARLVEVSMVKVDMFGLVAAWREHNHPVPTSLRRQTGTLTQVSSWRRQVRRHAPA